MTEAPICQHSDCDKPVSKTVKGLWSDFCSISCRSRFFASKESYQKAKETLLRNHNVTHPSKLRKKKPSLFELNGKIPITEKNVERAKDILNTIQPSGVVPKLMAIKDLWHEVESYCSDFKTRNKSEMVYLYTNQISQPLCDCGSDLPIAFESIVKGYRQFCSENCPSMVRQATRRRMTTQINNGGIGAARLSTKEKMLNTLTNTQGVANPGQLESHRKRMRSDSNPMKDALIVDAIKASNLKRYGVEWFSQRHDIKEKAAITNFKRYGFKNVGESPEIQEKIKQTCREKYGVDHHSQTAEVHLKKLKSGYKAREFILNEKTYLVQGYEPFVLKNILAVYDPELIQINPLPINYVFDTKTRAYFPDFTLNRIPCEVKSFYTFEKERNKNIAKLTASEEQYLFIYDDKYEEIFSYVIDETWFKFKSLLEKEFSSVESLVFENGKVYDFRINSSILLKINDARFNIDLIVGSKEHNTRYATDSLILRRDEVVEKESIVINTIKSKLGLITNKVYARKTSIEEINTNDAREFLNNHHIQGFVPGKVYLGLKYENNLVAVMVFSKQVNPSKNGESDWELTRYATSKNVIGGASRLLKHFIKNHDPKQIISYSDNMLHSGHTYPQIGFAKSHDVNPSYRYVVAGTQQIFHRRYFQKKKLEKKIGDLPLNMTERQITEALGIYRLYDAGKVAWIWKKENIDE